jgi:hypothetical protein
MIIAAGTVQVLAPGKALRKKATAFGAFSLLSY